MLQLLKRFEETTAQDEEDPLGEADDSDDLAARISGLNLGPCTFAFRDGPAKTTLLQKRQTLILYGMH